jgi:hypothetical protein
MTLCTVVEFLNNLWRLGTELEYGCCTGKRQATQPGGIGSSESILELLKSSKIQAQHSPMVVRYCISNSMHQRPKKLVLSILYALNFGKLKLIEVILVFMTIHAWYFMYKKCQKKLPN